MAKESNNPARTRSQKIYEWMLRAYPQAHREEYGLAMAQLFRDQHRDAWNESRGWGLTRLWLRVLPDWVNTSITERLSALNPRKSMSDKINGVSRLSTLPLITFVSVFAIVFLLVLTMSVIVTFIMPESYASTCRIKVENDVNNTIGGNAVTANQLPFDPYFVQTTFEIMRSQLVLSNVIASLDLNVKWGNKYTNGDPLKTTETMEILKGRMNLAPVTNTKLISITVYSDDPNEAAQIANAIAESYRDYRANAAVKADPKIQTVSLVQIVDQAEPGHAPVKPNKPLNIFIGVVAGGFLGLIAGGASALIAFKLGNRGRKNIASA